MIMLIFVMGALLGVLGGCTGTGNFLRLPPNPASPTLRQSLNVNGLQCRCSS